MCLYSPRSELPLLTVSKVSIMLLLLLIQNPDDDDELREKVQGNFREPGIMIIQLRFRKTAGLFTMICMFICTSSTYYDKKSPDICKCGGKHTISKRHDKDNMI